MIVVKSKLKIPTCKPEVQQTDMTSVYEICQKSQVKYVLTCHSLRMHFVCFLCCLKEISQATGYFSENANFQNFVKTPNSLKFKMF